MMELKKYNSESQFKESVVLILWPNDQIYCSKLHQISQTADVQQTIGFQSIIFIYMYMYLKKTYTVGQYRKQLLQHRNLKEVGLERLVVWPNVLRL